MPLKEWKISLDEGFTMLVRKETFLGVWISFAVVLIYDNECITRFDNAHGFPHRDVLGKNNGWIRKERCLKVVLKEAFEDAIRDTQTHRRAYLDFYLQN